MKNKITINLILYLFISLILLNSCDKNEDNPKNNDGQYKVVFWTNAANGDLVVYTSIYPEGIKDSRNFDGYINLATDTIPDCNTPGNVTVSWTNKGKIFFYIYEKNNPSMIWEGDLDVNDECQDKKIPR